MTATDPLLDPLTRPERLHYATGVLLDREDFRDEQTYHRGRLARLARFLHGFGTVAGLKVAHDPAVAPAGDDPGHEERLRIAAGLAVDRFGRQIELPEAACIRVAEWFAWQVADPARRSRLAQAVKPADAGQVVDGVPRPAGVVADVFLAFVPAPHGLTPAFDTGAFDALDATVPSRVRDAWRLELVPRIENAPARPQPLLPDPAGLPDAAARLARLRSTKLDDQWTVPGQWTLGAGAVALEAEHVPGHHDGSELLLARVVLPATVVAGLPTRVPGAAPWIDNTIRRFCYSTADLAWLAADAR